MFVKHYLHFNIRFSVGGGWGEEKCFPTYWTNHARLSQITREVVGGKHCVVLVVVCGIQ